MNKIFLILLFIIILVLIIIFRNYLYKKRKTKLYNSLNANYFIETLNKLIDENKYNLLEERIRLKETDAYGNEELKTLYANMDHCGDYICGNPQILKHTYPKYFLNNKSKMVIHETSNTN